MSNLCKISHNFFNINLSKRIETLESDGLFITLKHPSGQARTILSDTSEILEIIEHFFEVGKTKNLAPLRAIQLDDPRFSSYSDVPPLDLKDYLTTIALQELRFISISDYEYEIKNLRVDLFSDMAIATFVIKQTGVLVDSYSFRGQHLSMESRGTFVLIKSQKWKIVHIHLTKISD